ncbi:unnamed protein product [Cuscuta campestris]|uniref:Uncharacterized protein n=1 Tax=Cuscuta campestris TaxID=132261 RepID=A0A484LET4_9ASTE|nr:unnamed protein product [Cuscuta campestris]
MMTIRSEFYQALSSCTGDELCPVCTEAGARRAVSFVAAYRSAPGSGLAGERRPLKKSEGPRARDIAATVAVSIPSKSEGN